MKYQIDFEGTVPEWGTITLEANDLEQAEEFAREEIREFYPELRTYSIENIKEI